MSFKRLFNLYRNNLKNREFAKEAPQDFCLERTTIAGRQGVSEDKNPGVKLTWAKIDFSGCFGIACAMILWLPTFAQETPEAPPLLCCPYETIEPTLQVKGGYFFFSSSKMRKVYDEGGMDLQISGSVPCWRWLQLYGSLEYLQRHGRSLHYHQKTSIWQVPISIGLQAVSRITDRIDYYFTIGPRFFFVRTHHHSHYVSQTMDENGLGGFLGTGFHIFPYRHLLIDVFGEYSYKRMRFNSNDQFSYTRTTQIGGFTFGLGLGYAF